MARERNEENALEEQWRTELREQREQRAFAALHPQAWTVV